MALVDIWTDSPAQLKDKHVQQIIAFAGSGRLLDGSEAATEFRQFLSHVPSGLLSRYADESLTGEIDGGGFALQEVINQVGRRLGFRVSEENTRYL